MTAGLLQRSRAVLCLIDESNNIVNDLVHHE
jgi:hypothetical protein